ncbi:hypothetical protein KUA11_17355, partial [Acetobacter estunensis]
VTLLCAAFLLVGRIFRLGFLADFLSLTVLMGFLTGVGLQVSLGPTVIKGNARKVRRIGAKRNILAGFAGATADAFTLLER